MSHCVVRLCPHSPLHGPGISKGFSCEACSELISLLSVCICPPGFLQVAMQHGGEQVQEGDQDHHGIGPPPAPVRLKHSSSTFF